MTDAERVTNREVALELTKAIIAKNDFFKPEVILDNGASKGPAEAARIFRVILDIVKSN